LGVLRLMHRSEICLVTIVTVSPKYQIVIPKDVRDELGIRAGQKVEAFVVGTSIELVPLEPVQSLRGMFPRLPEFETIPDRSL
jgi:AbrB family looped-hinge helix DNA binding protein